MTKWLSGLILLLSMTVSVVVKADVSVGFHFYGALDCPPCMQFKREHLPDVQQQGREAGFSVSVNVIARTADVPAVGSFGESDALLRQAALQLPVTYPPIFFVTRNDQIAGAYLGDWQSALALSLGLM